MKSATDRQVLLRAYRLDMPRRAGLTLVTQEQDAVDRQSQWNHALASRSALLPRIFADGLLFWVCDDL